MVIAMSLDAAQASNSPRIGACDWNLFIRLARQVVHSTPWVDPMDVAQEAYVVLADRIRRGWCPENLTNQQAYCAVVVRNVLRRMVHRTRRSGELTAEGAL